MSENHLGGCHMGGDIGDIGTYSPEVWDYLIKTFNVKSIIDVGCGAGFSLSYFIKKGVDGIGVEGLQEAIDRSKVSSSIIKHDYTKGPFIPKKNIDLAWSCEFVEHVEEKYCDNFLLTFNKCKYVAMTYADVGQPGHHHVNCKNKTYWIDKLSKYNFIFLEKESEEAKKLLLEDCGKMKPHGNHVCSRLLIFKKGV